MTEEIIKARTDSGIIYIKTQKIYWEYLSKNLLEIEIGDIKAIGEYTTPHALHKNEWFIVFILQSREFQISTYAKGMTEVLEQLSIHFNSRVFGRLGTAETFESNIIYPPELKGQNMYSIEIKKTKTWFDRFRGRLGFGYPMELVLTKELADLSK